MISGGPRGSFNVSPYHLGFTMVQSAPLHVQAVANLNRQLALLADGGRAKGAG